MSNKDNNASQLSDKTLELKTDEINSACSKWESKVLSLDLSSIDVTSIFAPLTNLGIGASYIPSLKKALEKADNLVLSASKTIKETVSDQTAVDDNYKRRQSTGTGTRRSNSNGNSSNNSNNNSNTNSDSSTDDTSVDNKDKNVEINTNFINKVNQLDDEKYIQFMTLLGAATNGNLLQYLVDENSASVLKEVLLASQNLDPDLRQIISEMDENELQVTLQTMFTDEAAVTDLSRAIIYKYTENLANNSNIDMIKATSTEQFYNDVDELFNVVDALKETEDLKENVLAVYDGDVSENVSGNAVDFIRTAVDEVAASNNMTANELFEDAANIGKLKDVLTSLSKDLSFFRTVNTMGEEASELLYKSIIKKES